MLVHSIERAPFEIRNVGALSLFVPITFTAVVNRQRFFTTQIAQLTLSEEFNCTSCLLEYFGTGFTLGGSFDVNVNGMQ